MLDESKIIEIAEGIARKQVAGAGLERVLTRPTTDSEGNEALRITVVLKPEAVHRMTGDEALDLLVGLQQQLSDAGEERFPMVEYATEEELAEEEGAEEEL